MLQHDPYCPFLRCDFAYCVHQWYNVRMNKAINVRLDYELYLDLVALRDKIGVPVAESLRRAVREYLAKQETKTDADSKSL